MGVGASGGLLAGAAIIFVTLVGVVSFNVWPSTAGISSSGGNVELSAATPSAGGGGAPLSSASGQLAAVTPVAGGSTGDGGAAGGDGGADKGGKGGGSAGGQLGGVSEPPSDTTPATPPSSDEGVDGGPQPGTREPIAQEKPASGRSIREKVPSVPAGQSQRPGNPSNGKPEGGPPGQVDKPPVSLPSPPVGSDEDSDDGGDCRGKTRSRGRGWGGDDDQSSSSSRGSSNLSGRGNGRASRGSKH